MTLRLVVPPALLRAAAALLCADPARWPLQPKRVHVLDGGEPAPDGLSVAYLARAAALNGAARAGGPGLPAEIEAELDRAVVLEARLLALLGAAA